MSPTSSNGAAQAGSGSGASTAPVVVPPDQAPRGHAGRGAFEWDVYKNRRTALQYLKRNSILVDTILETEDGMAHELVHSQVLSAYGDKLTQFIAQNGVPIIGSTNTGHPHHASGGGGLLKPHHQLQPHHLAPAYYSTSSACSSPTNGPTASNLNPLKLVRLPKVNKYTLGILVECAYSGYIRTDLASGGIWQVLEVADYYQMSDVIRACCTFLIKSLDQSNCIQFYHIGIKHRHPLQRCAWHQIRANFKHILAQNIADSYPSASSTTTPTSGNTITGEVNEDQALAQSILGPNWSGAAVNAPHPGSSRGRHHNQSNSLVSLRVSDQQQQRLVATPLMQSPSAGRSPAASSFAREEVVSEATTVAIAAVNPLVRPALSRASRRRHPQTSTSTQSSSARASDREEAFTREAPPTPPPLNEKQTSNHNYNNYLATIKYEHFEPLLAHDKLNIDNEESVWFAIKLWCQYDLANRQQQVPNLLPCMRFPRLRSGTDFSARQIWRDPLILNNKQAQHQLAVLDRNHRDILTSSSRYGLGGGNNSSGGGGQLAHLFRDGFNLPCGVEPRQLRPRVPHSIILAIGGWQQGQPTTLIESYDLNCNLWFESKRRITSPLAYHGIECINGMLYICGGTDGSEILNEMFTFDPIRGDCSQKPSMRESRCYVSTSHLGGFLYAMGGHNGIQRMRSVERFDLTNETWSHVHDMNVARSDASACVHKDLIYVAGGLNDQLIESSVEFYNTQDDSWTFISSMLMPRTSFTLLKYRDTLLAIGGNNGTDRLNSVEQYNFTSKLWSGHSQMRHRRSTFSAALVDESKLFVVGGYNGQTPFAQVEMFDEPTRQWVPMQKIRYDRSGLKLVVIKDLPNAAEYTFLGSQSAAGQRANLNNSTGAD